MELMILYGLISDWVPPNARALDYVFMYLCMYGKDNGKTEKIFGQAGRGRNGPCKYIYLYTHSLKHNMCTGKE